MTQTTDAVPIAAIERSTVAGFECRLFGDGGALSRSMRSGGGTVWWPCTSCMGDHDVRVAGGYGDEFVARSGVSCCPRYGADPTGLIVRHVRCRVCEIHATM